MALDARAASAGIIKQVIAGKSLNQVMPSVLPNVAERDRSWYNNCATAPCVNNPASWPY